MLEKQCLDNLLASRAEVLDSQPDQLFLVQMPDQVVTGIIGHVIRFDYFNRRGLALAALAKAVTFSDRDPDQPRLQALDVF